MSVPGPQKRANSLAPSLLSHAGLLALIHLLFSRSLGLGLQFFRFLSLSLSLSLSHSVSVVLFVRQSERDREKVVVVVHVHCTYILPHFVCAKCMAVHYAKGSALSPSLPLSYTHLVTVVQQQQQQQWCRSKASRANETRVFSFCLDLK